MSFLRSGLIFVTIHQLCLSQIEKMNILFVMADDLRTELSTYGREYVISPNFERLSARGMTFDRAYTQVPVCFPSRHSILTGLRPDTMRIHTWTDPQVPYVDNLFSILVRRKYHSAGVGKLFHHPHNGSAEFPNGRWDGGWVKYQNEEDQYMNSSVTPDCNWNEDKFRDHIIASYGIAKLKELNEMWKMTGKPFILSVGFKLPHTQYHIPCKYFEMYRNNSYLQSLLKRSVGSNKFPDHAPRMNYRCCAKESFRPIADEGRHDSSADKLRLYGLMEFPNKVYREILRGYLSGVTFLDAQLGRLLNTMDELQLWQDTIVVFTSDHGMHVGEKGMWEKYTLWEETTRVPLIIADPRYRRQWGSHFAEPVELLDVMPTLLDLLGISGKSLAPIIRGSYPSNGFQNNLRNSTRNRGSEYGPNIDPAHASLQLMLRRGAGPNDAQASTGFVAITQMRRCLYPPGDKPASGAKDDKWSAICTKRNKGKGSVMGYSIRSINWRYTAWLPWDQSAFKPDLSRALVAEELYSHQGAPVREIFRERRNLVIFQGQDLHGRAKEALTEHRMYLETFLRTIATFGFDSAMNATKRLWAGKMGTAGRKGSGRKGGGMKVPAMMSATMFNG